MNKRLKKKYHKGSWLTIGVEADIEFRYDNPESNMDLIFEDLFYFIIDNLSKKYMFTFSLEFLQDTVKMDLLIERHGAVISEEEWQNIVKIMSKKENFKCVINSVWIDMYSCKKVHVNTVKQLSSRKKR